MKQRFAILPLGMGEFFSCRYYHSNLLLMLGDRLVQVDCPAPYRRMLSEMTAKAGNPLDYGAIDDVIVTHLHGDHCNGLEELALWKFYHQKRRIRLYTSPEVVEDLWAKLRGSLSWQRDERGHLFRSYTLDDYFDIHLWPLGSTQTLAGATFETHDNRHPVATFGFRMSFDGRSFGYSGDTAFDPEYIAWLAKADLVLHECNMPPAHTAYAELLTVDPAVRAKMRLFHVSDAFDIAGSAIPVVEQGKIIEL